MIVYGICELKVIIINFMIDYDVFIVINNFFFYLRCIFNFILILYNMYIIWKDMKNEFWLK